MPLRVCYVRCRLHASPLPCRRPPAGFGGVLCEGSLSNLTLSGSGNSVTRSTSPGTWDYYIIDLNGSNFNYRCGRCAYSCCPYHTSTRSAAFAHCYVLLLAAHPELVLAGSCLPTERHTPAHPDSYVMHFMPPSSLHAPSLPKC
jgi:hypothetical protein